MYKDMRRERDFWIKKFNMQKEMADSLLNQKKIWLGCLVLTYAVVLARILYYAVKYN
jgi:hypothetical protein